MRRLVLVMCLAFLSPAMAQADAPVAVQQAVTISMQTAYAYWPAHGYDVGSACPNGIPVDYYFDLPAGVGPAWSRATQLGTAGYTFFNSCKVSLSLPFVDYELHHAKPWVICDAVIHEVGHAAFGLEHTSDPRDPMFALFVDLLQCRSAFGVPRKHRRHSKLRPLE